MERSWLHGGSRATWVVAAAAVALGAGVAVVARMPATPRLPEVARELSLGSRWADSVEQALSHQTAREMSPGSVMAALYLERLRLGVGSPFRLVDYVLRDPLVPEGSRRLLAEAILARTQAGATYATPAEALSLIAVRPADGTGLLHREFMESVTTEARSPRVAELALRLAYTVGTASGAVSHRAPAVALAAIAQARDRALAMRDVDALVAEARRQRMEPVDLVPLWRAARRFTVERPLLDPPAPGEETAAVRLLPQLTARLESLADSSAVAEDAAAGDAPVARRRSGSARGGAGRAAGGASSGAGHGHHRWLRIVCHERPRLRGAPPRAARVRHPVPHRGIARRRAGATARGERRRGERTIARAPHRQRRDARLRAGARLAPRRRRAVHAGAAKPTRARLAFLRRWCPESAGGRTSRACWPKS